VDYWLQYISISTQLDDRERGVMADSMEEKRMEASLVEQGLFQEEAREWLSRN
jgi:hypothetical protein